jgi:hypothetical protein
MPPPLHHYGSQPLGKLGLLLRLLAFSASGSRPATVADAVAQGETVTTTMPLFPSAAPGERGDTEHEHVTNSSDGRLIANVSVPTLSMHLPPVTGDGRFPPVVLIFPGGGFEHLYIDKEGTEVVPWLTSLGIAACVVKYRVPLLLPRPELPGLRQPLDAAAEIWRPLMDVQRALGLVRARCSSGSGSAAADGGGGGGGDGGAPLLPGWRCNASAVGVLGFSAGGALAGALSTHYQTRLYPHIDAADTRSARPDFTLMVYPAPLTGALGMLAAHSGVPVSLPAVCVLWASLSPSAARSHSTTHICCCCCCCCCWVRGYVCSPGPRGICTSQRTCSQAAAAAAMPCRGSCRGLSSTAPRHRRSSRRRPTMRWVWDRPLSHSHALLCNPSPSCPLRLPLSLVPPCCRVSSRQTMRWPGGRRRQQPIRAAACLPASSPSSRAAGMASACAPTHCARSAAGQGAPPAGCALWA